LVAYRLDGGTYHVMTGVTLQAPNPGGEPRRWTIPPFDDVATDLGYTFEE
jgi:hypothetical protein